MTALAKAASGHLKKAGTGHLARGCCTRTNTCGCTNRPTGYGVIIRDVNGANDCVTDCRFLSKTYVYGSPNGFSGIGQAAQTTLGSGRVACVTSGDINRGKCYVGLRSDPANHPTCDELKAAVPAGATSPQLVHTIFPTLGVEEVIISAGGTCVFFYARRAFSAGDCGRRRTFSNMISVGDCIDVSADYGNVAGQNLYTGVGSGGTVEFLPCAAAGTNDTVTPRCRALYESRYNCLTRTWSAPTLVSTSCIASATSDWFYDHTDSDALTTYVYYRKYVLTNVNCDCADPNCSTVSPFLMETPGLTPPECPGCGTCAACCRTYRVKYTFAGVQYTAALVRTATCQWATGDGRVLQCVDGRYVLTIPTGGGDVRFVTLPDPATNCFKTDVTKWALDDGSLPATLDEIKCVTCGGAGVTLPDYVRVQVDGGDWVVLTNYGGTYYQSDDGLIYLDCVGGVWKLYVYRCGGDCVVTLDRTGDSEQPDGSYTRTDDGGCGEVCGDSVPSAATVEAYELP